VGGLRPVVALAVSRGMRRSEIVGLRRLVALGDTLEIATMWRFTRNNGITEGFPINGVEPVNPDKAGLASLISASWNQLVEWLRRIGSLREFILAGPDGGLTS
jgi:hypothetical protein